MENKKDKGILSLSLTLVCMLCCWYFRVAIPPMLVIAFIVLLIVRYKNRREVLISLFICFFFGIFALGAVFTYIFPVSLEHIIWVTGNRISAKGSNLLFGWIVNIAGALVGPFPTFNRAANDALLVNVSLLFKLQISFALLIGIWRILKSYSHRYYALMVYVSLGVIMLILSGTSLDMRYQITFFPLMLVIIAYAFQKKINKIFYNMYIAASFVMVLIFNSR
jgi:hypothetical protein